MRLGLRSVLCWVLAISATSGLAAQTVVRSERDNGVVDVGIVIPPGEFRPAKIQKLAAHFLKLNDPALPLQRLIVATSQQALLESYYHGGPSPTAASTILEIQRTGTPTGPLARLLAVNGRAKLTLFENGALTDKILSGATDPTIFHDQGNDYQVLHFKLFGHGNEGDSGHRPSLRIFLKSSQISISSCIAITTRIHRLTRSGTLTVEIRRDPWFLTDQQYPAVLAFSKFEGLPNQELLEIAPRVSCGVNANDRIACSGQNFAP